MATNLTTPTVTQDVPTQDPMLAAFQQKAQGGQPAASKPDKQQWTPSPNDPVTHVQTSDGQEYHVHSDDLDKLKAKDPGVKVIRQVQDDPMLAAFNARKRGGGLPPGSIQLRKGGPVYTDKDFELSADNPIMPKDGEDFHDTLLRAQEAGRRSAQAGTLQREIKKEQTQDLKKAPFVLAAAPVMGAGGAAGIVGAGELGGAAFAPAVTENTVGTGILDEFGKEIVRQVTKIGPSKAAQLASRIAQYAARPGHLVKFPGGALAEKLIVGDLLRRTKLFEGLLGHFGLAEGSPE